MITSVSGSVLHDVISDLYYAAPLLGADLPEIIENEYIVVFESIDRVSSQQGVNTRARVTS